MNSTMPNHSFRVVLAGLLMGIFIASAAMLVTDCTGSRRHETQASSMEAETAPDASN